LLQQSERLAQEGNNRLRLRDLYHLRGEWKVSLCQWSEAAGAFEEEIRMSREANLDSSVSEARLALAQFHLGQLQLAKDTADRLALLPTAPKLELAELYLVLGDHFRAHEQVVPAYELAWADGPPYAYWWNLQRCRNVFKTLRISEPRLLSLHTLDQTKEESFPFEVELLVCEERARGKKGLWKI
jgi:hypothetical protein